MGGVRLRLLMSLAIFDRRPPNRTLRYHIYVARWPRASLYDERGKPSLIGRSWVSVYGDP